MYDSDWDDSMGWSRNMIDINYIKYNVSYILWVMQQDVNNTTSELKLCERPLIDKIKENNKPKLVVE